MVASSDGVDRDKEVSEVVQLFCLAHSRTSSAQSWRLRAAEVPREPAYRVTKCRSDLLISVNTSDQPSSGVNCLESMTLTVVNIDWC